MATAVVDSRSLGPQSGGFFGWMLAPLGGNRAHGTASTPSMERVSSSSSSSSLASSSSDMSSSDSYSRSSSANSHTCSDDGMDGAVLVKDFVPSFIPDKSEMKRVFERFDENNDGLICAKDLHRFMGRFGVEMSVEEAKSMLQSVDKNEDGCVDFDEFYSLYMALSDDMAGAADDAVDEEDTLEQVFKVFDRNGDGHITPQELQEVLIQLGIPEARSIRNCEEMIQRVDSNGDKKIDISEFKAMMCSNCFQNLC